MNPENKYYSYSSTTSTQNNVPSIDLGLFTIGLSGAVIFYLLFCLIIFIIWVWSMISMINLNSRFKDFFDYYTAQTNNRNEEDASNARLDELRNFKTEEEREIEHRELISSMKPRRAYVLIAAIGIPILLIILLLAPRIFR